MRHEVKRRSRRKGFGKLKTTRVQFAACFPEDRVHEKSKAVSDSGACEVFLPEMSRLLLQLSRDRGDAARHRASCPALRARLQAGRGALHEVRPGGKGSAATPQEGQGVRFD